MSTALANTAEGGTNGATPTSGDAGSGNAFDAVLINSGTAITYDTTHPVHGTKSYKYVTGPNNLLVAQKWIASLTAAAQGFVRCYVYLTAYPTVSLCIARWVDGSGNTVARLNISNAGALSWNDQNGVQRAVCTTKIALNTKARVEGSVVSSAAAGTGSCSLFQTDPDSTTPDETHPVTGQATNGNNITEVWFGKCSTNATGNITFWVDDPAVSTIAAIGPSATVTAPSAPTAVSAVAHDSSAVVSFTPGATGGGTITYTATSSPGGLTASGSGTGLTVSGLTNGTAYTFTVTASNAAGSATSSASGSVTPAAPGSPSAQQFWGIPISTSSAIILPPPSAGMLNGVAPGTSPSLQAAWNNMAQYNPNFSLRAYDKTQPATYAASNAGAITGPVNRLLSTKPPYFTGKPPAGWDTLVGGYAATVPVPTPGSTRVCGHHEPENDGVTEQEWADTVIEYERVCRAANPNLLTGIITVANSPKTAGFLAAALAGGLDPNFYYCDGYSGIPPSLNPPYPSPATVFAHYLSLHATYFPNAEKGVAEWGQNSKQGDRSPFLIAAWAFGKKNGFTGMWYFQSLNPWTLNTQKELKTLGGLV